MKRTDPKKFIISLEKVRDQRGHCVNNILREFPDAQVVNALDGQTFELSDENKKYSSTFGCLASHLQIFSHCILNDIQYALIFEDDLELDEAGGQKIKQSMRDVDLQTFTWHSQPNKFLCAAAYKINLRAMDLTLANLKNIKYNTMLYHVDRLISNTLDKYKLEFDKTYANLDQNSLQPSHTRKRDSQVDTSVIWGSPKKIGWIDYMELRKQIDKPLEFV